MGDSSTGLPRAAVPFLKWAGGKSVIADKIIAQIGRLAPGSTYFEPFLGGGAVFFRLAPGRATLMDSNAALVGAYRVVKDRVGPLISQLSGMKPPDGKDEFERRRDEFNDLLVV